MDKECVFCRIASGELPARVICEDDRALAIMDINPVAPGHALVITREHAQNLMAVSPQSLAAAVAMAQRVARAVERAMAPDGINLLQANGPGAAQSVPHFHLHVIPRQMEDGLAMNWLLTPGNPEAIQAACEAVRAALD